MPDEQNQSRIGPEPAHSAEPIVFRQISMVTASDLALVSARPRLLDRVAVEKLLRADERLISFGQLERPRYFAFNEQFIAFALIIVVVSSALRAAFTDPAAGNFFIRNIAALILIPSLLILVKTSIRRSSFAMTSERLLVFGQYTFAFELSAFEGAVINRKADGQTFLELMRPGGLGPAVVMEFVLAPQEASVRSLLPPHLAVLPDLATDNLPPHP